MLSAGEQRQFFIDTRTFRDKFPRDFYTVVETHHKLSGVIHGKEASMFLVWHRYYVFYYENKVSKALNKRFVQPYWSWGSRSDYADPSNSPILTTLGFGGNGQDDEGIEFVHRIGFEDMGTLAKPNLPDNIVKGKCIGDGEFVDSYVQYPFRACILRNFNDGSRFNGKMAAFPSTADISNMMGSPTLQSFRSQIESLVHAVPHDAMGGFMRSMNSPNDPCFFLHHGFIDMLFYMWQTKNSKVGFTAVQDSYDQYIQAKGNFGKLQVYPFKCRAEQLMKIENLCYTYEEYVQAPPPDQDFGSLSNAGRNFLSDVKTSAEAVDDGFGGDSWGADESSNEEWLQRRELKELSKEEKVKSTCHQIVSACKRVSTDPDKSAVTEVDPPLLVAFNPKVRLVPLKDGNLPAGYVDIGASPMMPPVQDFWIKLNNLNKSRVDEHYRSSSNLNSKVNSVPGYIPPGAPWHCEKTMDILYSSNKTLCIVVNGTAVVSEPSMRGFADPGARLMKSYMLNTVVSDDYWKPVSKIAPILINIFGTPATQNPNCGLNPFFPRFASEVGLGRSDFTKDMTKESASKSVFSVIKRKLKESNKTEEVQVVNPSVIQGRMLKDVIKEKKNQK